jgi:hypothetical protein
MFINLLIFVYQSDKCKQYFNDRNFVRTCRTLKPVYACFHVDRIHLCAKYVFINDNKSTELFIELNERLISINKSFGRIRLNDLGKPVNDLGKPVNDLGKPVNDLGTPLNELGTPLNELGTPLNELGEPLNELGDPQNEFGKPLTPFTFSDLL